MVEQTPADQDQIRTEILRYVVHHVFRLSPPDTHRKGCTGFFLQAADCLMRGFEKRFAKRLVAFVVLVPSALNRVDELNFAMPPAGKFSRPLDYPDIRRLDVNCAQQAVAFSRVVGRQFRRVHTR